MIVKAVRGANTLKKILKKRNCIETVFYFSCFARKSYGKMCTIHMHLIFQITPSTHHMASKRKVE